VEVLGGRRRTLRSNSQLPGVNVCKYMKVRRAALGVCSRCSLNPISMDKDIKVTDGKEKIEMEGFCKTEKRQNVCSVVKSAYSRYYYIKYTQTHLQANAHKWSRLLKYTLTTYLRCTQSRLHTQMLLRLRFEE